MKLILTFIALALASASFGQSPIPITGTGHVECTFAPDGTGTANLTISGESADESVSFSGTATYPGTGTAWVNLCTKAQMPIASCAGAPMYCRESFLLPGQLLTGTASSGGQTADDFTLELFSRLSYLNLMHEGEPTTTQIFGFIKMTSQSRTVLPNGTQVYTLDFLILDDWASGEY